METFLKYFFTVSSMQKNFKYLLPFSRLCGSKFEPLKPQNDTNT